MGMPEMFGSMVFSDRVMKNRLPHETYKQFKKALAQNQPLTRDIAGVVANAMKDWAIEKGATHYTHWFQPMTGVTAEKHESFIAASGDTVIMEFSGKELIKGEPDASSFPSGGLRATFEARGYTAWDPTSYAFIKGNTLCIPTAFCSWGGEVLDKKTPLLRSMAAIDAQVLRILRLFGRNDVKRVSTTVGPEQEYFLIDKNMFEARPDLIYTGRTLFGVRPPKGQELDDHYFGSLKGRVSGFMRDLDEELWKLGVLAKTEHNETAPAQHELAPLYTTTNIATDHNQLVMELLKKVAARHNMACLLHEKPFMGVNGSGKHNNWSIQTDTGANLLEPGASPSDNAQFLLFLVAVIAAVDKHQDLLRISTAGAGNDLRLGAAEAPPAILSVSLGEELTGILEAIEQETAYDKRSKVEMRIGVDFLPPIPKDTTDRNRTSPLAFTGNKFEFRMLGSSFSTAGPNFILNTIVADQLMRFADILEQASDFTVALNALIRDTIRAHKRILFNGNNYTSDWVLEAKRRGLLNLSSSPEALVRYTDPENVALFKRHGIFTESEIKSRQEILLESYVKVVRIEALTMLDMVSRDYLPAILSYSKELAQGACLKAQIGIEAQVELKLCAELSELLVSIDGRKAALERALDADTLGCSAQRAAYYQASVLPLMQALRAAVDDAEPKVDKKRWPYPSYGEILFSVR